MEKEKGSLIFQLGPREIQKMKEIPLLVKKGKLPDNKSEIFRRGFHAVRELVEVNERPLLKLLFEKLQFGIKNPTNKDNAEYLIALSSVIYATLIAKRGILGAESFETIPRTCKYLSLIGERVDINESDVSRTLAELASTTNTIFLKNVENTLNLTTSSR
jgi:hypothetical protein